MKTQENTMKYQLIVGNIGTLDYSTFIEAKRDYNLYVYQSKNFLGRVAGESVALVDAEYEIMFEHEGQYDLENNR